MNLETKKMIEINTTKPTSIHTPATGHDREGTQLTVKAAAQRLRNHRQRCNRIDRKNGPFRFVIDGHRVFHRRRVVCCLLSGIDGIRGDDGREVSECLQPAQEPAEQAGGTVRNGGDGEDQINLGCNTNLSVPASGSEASGN